MKWDIFPLLQFTAAVYNLDRHNQRFPDPNNPGFFILSGRTNTKGFEIGLVGYIIDWWQVVGRLCLYRRQDRRAPPRRPS